MGEAAATKKSGILFVLADTKNAEENESKKTSSSSIDDLTIFRELVTMHGFEKFVAPNMNDSKAIIDQLNSNMGGCMERYRIPIISLIDTRLIPLFKDEIKPGSPVIMPDQKCFGYMFINKCIAYLEDKLKFPKGSTVIVYGSSIEIRSRTPLESLLNVTLVEKVNNTSPNELKKTRENFISAVLKKREYLLNESNMRDPEYLKKMDSLRKESEDSSKSKFSFIYNPTTYTYILSGILDKSDDVSPLLQDIRSKMGLGELDKNLGKVTVSMESLEKINDSAMSALIQLPGIMPAQVRFIVMAGYEKFKGTVHNMLYDSFVQKFSSGNGKNNGK